MWTASPMRNSIDPLNNGSRTPRTWEICWPPLSHRRRVMSACSSRPGPRNDEALQGECRRRRSPGSRCRLSSRVRRSALAPASVRRRWCRARQPACAGRRRRRGETRSTFDNMDSDHSARAASSFSVRPRSMQARLMRRPMAATPGRAQAPRRVRWNREALPRRVLCEWSARQHAMRVPADPAVHAPRAGSGPRRLGRRRPGTIDFRLWRLPALAAP